MPPPSSETLAPGTVLGGRYRIEGALARGGMGAVYLALDDKLGRNVAIKVLRAELGEDHTAHKRFEREAVVVAKLAHPGIAQVLDFGEAADGASYIVLERVPGETISAILKRQGRLPPARAAEITRQALDALSAAHAVGVVHRDLKPGNLMVFATGVDREAVKVLDFGIAQLMQTDAYTRLTQTGALIGTPAFMAPEQAMGMPTDVRTDVYAMGVLLYCMLSGRRPFEGTPVQMLEAILRDVPEPLSTRTPDVPRELSLVVERAMQRDPSRRFASATEMSSAVARAQRTTPAPPTGAWASPVPQSSAGSGSSMSPASLLAVQSLPSIASTASASMAATQSVLSQRATSSMPNAFDAASAQASTMGVPSTLTGSAPKRPLLTRNRILVLLLVAALGGALSLAIAGVALYVLWPSIAARTAGASPTSPTVWPSAGPSSAAIGGSVCVQARECCVAYYTHMGGPVSTCDIYGTVSYETNCAQALEQFRSGRYVPPECAADPTTETSVAAGDACMRAYTCCLGWARSDSGRVSICAELLGSHDAAYCDAQRAHYAPLTSPMYCR